MVGDKLWERFNAPKEKQYWYYSSVVNALASLRENENVAATYEEMTELMKKVFAKVMREMADKSVQDVIEKWKTKKEDYRKEWEKGYWPAKYVSISFKLFDKEYRFTPDTIGLETGDCWDEGFMEYLQKYIVDDLLEIGATDIFRLGFLD